MESSELLSLYKFYEKAWQQKNLKISTGTSQRGSRGNPSFPAAEGQAVAGQPAQGQLQASPHEHCSSSPAGTSHRLGSQLQGKLRSSCRWPSTSASEGQYCTRYAKRQGTAMLIEEGPLKKRREQRY